MLLLLLVMWSVLLVMSVFWVLVWLLMWLFLLFVWALSVLGLRYFVVRFTNRACGPSRDITDMRLLVGYATFHWAHKP